MHLLQAYLAIPADLSPADRAWMAGLPRLATFTAFGKRGTPAEDVGIEVASQFAAWRDSRTAVDEHLTDQLMVPLAIAGAGRVPPSAARRRRSDHGHYP